MKLIQVIPYSSPFSSSYTVAQSVESIDYLEEVMSSTPALATPFASDWTGVSTMPQAETAVIVSPLRLCV